MSFPIKKHNFLIARKFIVARNVNYSKQWPDDKWIIMNGLRRIGNWWQTKLHNLDQFCACVPNIYPNMPPPINPESKFETIKDNLQPIAIRYWFARSVCLVRGQVLAIQATEWHDRVHTFIMNNIQGSIATVKNFLERNLLDDQPPSGLKSDERAKSSLTQQPMWSSETATQKDACAQKSNNPPQQ